MVKLVCGIFLCAISAVTAFLPQVPGRQESSIFVQKMEHSTDSSRSDFLTVAISAVGATIVLPNKADARGRATLEFSYDRYTPRILDGGVFYANDLKKAIANNDWKAIKVCVAYLICSEEFLFRFYSKIISIILFLNRLLLMNPLLEAKRTKQRLMAELLSEQQKQAVFLYLELFRHVICSLPALVITASLQRQRR